MRFASPECERIAVKSRNTMAAKTVPRAIPDPAEYLDHAPRSRRHLGQAQILRAAAPTGALATRRVAPDWSTW
jgi:hypothetical protein